MLATVFLLAVLLVAPFFRPAQAKAHGSRSLLDAISSPRLYYLTPLMYTSIQAPTACAKGYHFASIWELADPSSLIYKTSLGLTSTDSGEGPPVAIPFLSGVLPVSGWIRTGYNPWSADTAGRANCTAWLSDYSFDWGTTAKLPSSWTGGAQDLGVWDIGVKTCDSLSWVWCVEDKDIWQVYLPGVLD